MMLKSKLRWMLKSKQIIMLKSKLRRKLISITYIFQSIMLCIIRLDLLRAFHNLSISADLLWRRPLSKFLE
jgi:hypothetical protein